jgi:general secretion pathway protein K
MSSHRSISSHRAPRPARRGSVIVVVLWAIAIAAIVGSSVQLFGYRQATLGREAVGRLQARWAARAGVENIIAVMAHNTKEPSADDALAMVRDMEVVSTGDLLDASYDIRHHSDGRNWAGPMDEHAKIHLNLPDEDLNGLLFGLDDVTLDMLDVIADWKDEDDDVRLQGAEADWYAYSAFPYEPRNGPYRSVAELELAAGLDPELVRGEDVNLDHQLDAHEDDGEISWPDDDADGVMEPGLFAQLTVHSVANGATTSGQPRIRLGLAEPADLVERLGVSTAQAEGLNQFGRQPESRMEMLLTQSFSTIQGDGTFGQQPAEDGAVEDLTYAQVRAVFEETQLESIYARPPGKINLNSVSSDLLGKVLAVLLDDETVADEIRYLRDSRQGGILSLADLLNAPSLSSMENAADVIGTLGTYFTTQSNVYTITSKGRSWGTGMEAEMIVVVDRSTLPVKILEYREP